MKRFRRKMVCGVAGVLLFAGCRSDKGGDFQADAPKDGVTFYVSTKGNDAWSGSLPKPNWTGTDGPFATVTRARDAVRALKASSGPLSVPVTVLLRGGRYYVTEPLRFGAEDSGTESCPVTYAAYRREMPELIGGRQLTGFQPTENGQVSLTLPEVKAGTWTFRSLFVNDERQVRARFPNIDPADPYRRGFLYNGVRSGLGNVVGCIHNAGDWMEYKMTVPAAGDYTFWMFYAAMNNNPSMKAGMSERTELIVDNGTPIPLRNLPDTGGWSTFKWSAVATVTLTPGEHVMRWRNVKGGGLNLVAYAFCNDPAWKPVDETPSAVDAGRHLILVRAADFVASQGKQLAVSGFSGKKSATLISCPPDVFKPAWLAPDVELHIYQSGSCRAFMEIVSIQSYDPVTHDIKLQGPECLAPLAAGDRYYVENVFEELDSPGEWYLNRQTGVLSYMPKPGFTEKSEVIAPTVKRIFDIQGVDGKTPVTYLRLSGLTLRCTDWELGDGSAGYGMGSDGVVCLGNAEGCVVENCEFRNTGKYAVCIKGGRRNRVEGCEIAHSGSGGVLILDSSGNTVTDNHVHHCGEGYKHNGGVVLQGPQSSGNTVSHNAIHDTSRYGISLKNAGSTNVVEYNRVQNTNLETYDTGGIEVTQGNRDFRSGSVIRGNLVADTIGYSSTGDKPCFMSWGIYLDSFAGGYEVTGNITYRNSHGGIMLQGGKDNRVTNNIFVDSCQMQGLLANYIDNSRGQVLERNIFYWAIPDAVLYATGKLVTPEVVRVDRNLIYQVGAAEPRVGWGGGMSFADWQARGFDKHSVYADPLFADPAKDDYALRPDSPAFKLGFVPIDVSKIGPVKRRCSCSTIPAGPLFWPRESE